MTDGDPRADKPAGMSRGLKLALYTALAVGALAVVLTVGRIVFQPGPSYIEGKGPAGTSGAVVDPAAPPKAAGLTLPAPSPKGTGEAAPTVAFKDASGGDTTLAAFRGKVVVLNLWATWCAPCRKEMPTLAALQALSAGKDVRVVPVSVDSAAKTAAAKAFIAEHRPLDFYQDAGTALPFALKPPAQGFPTTIIYDKAGLERIRVSGDLDWSSPKVRRVLDALAAE